LIRNPSETFFVKASGDSMVPVICDGDYLVVQKGLKPKNGSIIVAQIDDEFSIKRFFKNYKGIRLVPENPSFKEILVEGTTQFWLCGVVIGSAKSLLNSNLNVIINTANYSFSPDSHSSV
jgi:DNA polymerase V